jgi:hypothetical protein
MQALPADPGHDLQLARSDIDHIEELFQFYRE